MSMSYRAKRLFITFDPATLVSFSYFSICYDVVKSLEGQGDISEFRMNNQIDDWSPVEPLPEVDGRP